MNATGEIAPCMMRRWWMFVLCVDCRSQVFVWWVRRWWMFVLCADCRSRRTLRNLQVFDRGAISQLHISRNPSQQINRTIKKGIEGYVALHFFDTDNHRFDYPRSDACAR